MKFEGTHAVVTGGGSGIGAAIVAALLGCGYRVSSMGRSRAALKTAANEFNRPGQVRAIPCDVTSDAAVEDSFAKAVGEFGSIDILVNCAGAAPAKPFHKLSTGDWNNVMAVNLNGVFNCTSQVINSMRERKSGRIINIASTASLKGYTHLSAYCAAKHGVLGMTRALALETARHGISVNSICPGYTDTDIIRKGIQQMVASTNHTEEQALAGFVTTNPQGRLIDPDEVASTVVWLCSENSRSITGQAISISGGEVM